MCCVRAVRDGLLARIADTRETSSWLHLYQVKVTVCLARQDSRLKKNGDFCGPVRCTLVRCAMCKVASSQVLIRTDAATVTQPPQKTLFGLRLKFSGRTAQIEPQRDKCELIIECRSCTGRESAFTDIPPSQISGLPATMSRSQSHGTT